MIDNRKVEMISSYLKDKFKSVNDINFDEVAVTFIEKGAYDANKSLTENMNELIRTMAIGKACGMFDK